MNSANQRAVSDLRVVTGQIPGDDDTSGRGVINFEWNRLKQVERKLSRVVDLSCRLQRVMRHCAAHPNDIQAFRRLALLATKDGNVTLLLHEARREFREVSAQYRLKMVKLAKVPIKYQHVGFLDLFYFTEIVYDEPFVQIIDNSGSVRIHFGRDLWGGEREGCWELYSNGVVRKIRTPDDVLDD